jgi:hypothetical protein
LGGKEMVMNRPTGHTANNPMRRAMLALLFGLALTACRGGGSSDPGNPPGGGSAVVTVCNGVTTTRLAPGTAWPRLNCPLATKSLDIATDGRAIEANVTISVPSGSTVHQLRFKATRE